MSFQWSFKQRRLHQTIWILLFASALLFIQLAACKKDPPVFTPPVVNGYDPTPYELNYPQWFPIMPLSDANPMTEEGVALGRKLYYDPLLHPQGAMSCSSCHLQSQSFTISNSGTAVLAHINLGWSDAFLWNGKVEGTLEDIMLFEVCEFFKTDLTRLQADPQYPGLFLAAFGNKTITSENCALALAQFFRTQISADSRFDRYTYVDQLPTPAEVKGERIFNSEQGDCFHCHPQPLFTDNLFHNIGLDSVLNPENYGRFEVTSSAHDKGLFKTPTLRNISLTAPYMHDGRFQTLEEVIDHYDHGVKHTSTLDPIMTKPGKENGLKLSEEDKANLIAFLKSLTDSAYITNPALSAP